ncbi:contractile injection system protein, VgrG/Pvc8 family, partial [Acinetobacter baumannii]
PHDHVHTEQAHDMWGDFSQPKAGASGIADAGTEAEKEAQYLASVMAHALHSQARLVSGAGNLRGLMAGYTLHIVEHPQKAANCEYSV